MRRNDVAGVICFCAMSDEFILHGVRCNKSEGDDVNFVKCNPPPPPPADSCHFNYLRKRKEWEVNQIEVGIRINTFGSNFITRFVKLQASLIVY